MKRNIGKSLLLVSAAVPLLALSGHALAQDAKPSTEPAADTTTVVVTGTRASNRRAVAIKRNSDAIMDTVSATEIGALPDFNAGDALKRVPGVNALLYQGEPRFLIVRGFNQNYNTILIDGFSLASTDINLGQSGGGGRQVSMEILPSNLASHIDVIKAPTPATDANFIGGLATFASPSAFDFKRNQLSASVVGGLALDKKGNGGSHPLGQAQVSKAMRFGDHDQFGLYMSATYWTRQINVPQAEFGGTRNWYTSAGAPTTPYGGTGYAVPSQRLYYNYQNERSRSGLQARLDYRPTSDFKAYVNAYYYHQNEKSYRNDLNAGVQASSQVAGQTATSGTLTNVTQQIQLGRYRWNRGLGGAYSRFDWNVTDAWKVDGGLSWSNSTVRNPQTVDNFAQTALQYNYDTSGSTPTFSAVNPTLAGDYTKYKLGFHREELFKLSENRYDAQLNLAHNVGSGARGWGFGVGVRFTGISQQVSFTRTSWTGNFYTLADVVSGKTLCGFLCDTPVPVISSTSADSLWKQNIGAMTATVDLASGAGGTYSTNEGTSAAYGMFQYRTDRLFVVGGLRTESTAYQSASTQATNGIYSPVSAKSNYTKTLPSISAVYDTGDFSKLRLSASETLSRPTFAGASLHGGVLNTLSTPPTLSVGNPNLLPRDAQNYDISHDWYIDGGHGLISVAGFYKVIKNEIFTYGALQTVSGSSVPVLVTQARNSNKTVYDQGVEFSFGEDLTFLPAPWDGLGVSFNATLSRATFPVTLSDGSTVTMRNLPDQPKEIYNASVYYEKGNVHAKLAWNHLGQLWDDRFPNFTPSGFYANRYQQPTDNFDIQTSYDVTSNWAVTLDVLNLTKQGMQYKYGSSQELLQSEWRLPPQVMFGVKYKN